MIGKLVPVLAAALVAGACGPAQNQSGEPRPLPERENGGGPKVILRVVEIVEMRPDGGTYRLASDDASFSIPPETVDASGVRLWLREREGAVVATAPRASWDLNDGRIDLAEGAAVENGAGWNATAPRASIDLKSEVIAAEDALLAGPGFTVEGRNLRWRWQDGAVELDSPRSNILPGSVLGPERRG